MPLIQPAVPPNPPIDLSGKTIIVTGGNVGLGYATIQQFLVNKASIVILACRTLSKGETARREILADLEVKRNNPQGKIVIMKLDMERYDSVLEFANQVKKDFSTLHICLLNAGMGSWGYKKSPTGHETVLQVNYLSNALLTFELLPLLEKTAKDSGSPSRLSWVGSRMHERNSLVSKRPILSEENVLTHFDDPANFNNFDTYSDSKLLCVMFLTVLAKNIEKDSIIINSMCPGMVKTNIANSTPFLIRSAVNVVQALRARTQEKGAWILVNAAAVAGGETHGKFLTDKEITP